MMRIPRCATNPWPDGMSDDLNGWFAIAFCRAALRLLADRPGGRRWVLEFIAEELAQDEQDRDNDIPQPL
jgi:hypothetical protein